MVLIIYWDIENLCKLHKNKFECLERINIQSYTDARVKYIPCSHNFIRTLNHGIDIAVCGGYMHSFGMYSRLMKVPLDYVDIVTTMIIHCPMMNPTGFIRRDFLIDHHIRYSEGYSFAADFKLWSDIARIGKVVNIPEVFTWYRTYPEQMRILIPFFIRISNRFAEKWRYPSSCVRYILGRTIFAQTFYYIR